MSNNEWDERARKYLEIGKENSVLVGRDKKTGKVVGVIKFARAEMSDWEEIKAISTEELIKRYVSLSTCMKYSVSVRDCELQGLMEMELSRRGVKYEDIEPRLKEAAKEAERLLEADL